MIPFLRRTWVKFSIQLLVIAVTSIVLSLLLWKWFDEDIYVHFGTLEINFFNTVCGLFTIIALLLTIYQLAALKSRKDFQKETIAQTETNTFKKMTLSTLAGIKADLMTIRDKILRHPLIDDQLLSDCISTFYKTETTISSIKIQQDNLTGNNLIDCTNSLTLHQAILQRLQKIDTEKSYKKFQRQSISSDINQLITELSNCESKITI
ncbi:hypothetical protein [Ferruginibacter sp. HRS2-29]|uniref:hypothetical protein n=1 Tax=Ferruginibacter sp. HRS2-29 TaxID=2487334 RepID=UPI0020CC5A96|nr:hypothetical protein [Ferruginibacter sp. HRS2-29]MCP9753408.1 hypothetical protein [Ferruginibacter sp. HRS2-29]